MGASERYWFIAGIYMGLIFIASSIPGKPLPKISTIDKLIHLIEFGILSWILGKAFRTSQKETFIKQASIFSILITILYGIGDEIHQSFVPFRDPGIYDVLFDGIGAILAQGIFLIYRKGHRDKDGRN